MSPPGAQYRRRVGAARPSHLMFTGGVGALVDLPNFSALVGGLDDWRYDQLPEENAEPLVEQRLLAATRKLLGPGVAELLSPPWAAGFDDNPNGLAARVGVPVTPFPRWLRCTACNELAPLDSGIFGFENDKPRRPHDARFYHADCARRRKPLAVAARFVLACTAGHLDELPYVHFVHDGGDCPRVSHPRLRMDDRGGNLGANVQFQCVNCGQQRNIKAAMGRRGEQNLPRCRGRHPHLATFAPKGCDSPPKLLVVGASNQWFAQTLSALAVPEVGASALDAKVQQYWQNLHHITGLSMMPFMRSVAPLSHELSKWSDAEVWDAIERQRKKLESGEDDEGAARYPDLRTPEWEVFANPEASEATDGFTLRQVDVPAELAGTYADVVQAERLREVRALVGFTRLDAPDPDDPELVRPAPLTRSAPTWVPATEVRGEGVFLRLPEDLLAAWEKRVGDSAAMRAHREAYARFRENRYSGRVPGDFDAMAHWPGERYLALHTLSHLLIRTIALECGYSAASLSERVYAGTEDDPRGGILVYTAVPDAEGTLGGLVSLAEPEALVRLTRRALDDARHCSSDPLCAERLPQAPDDFLHGAACHVCLFVSETTCERGNRFLDRRFVVPVDAGPALALLPDPL